MNDKGKLTLSDHVWFWFVIGVISFLVLTFTGKLGVPDEVEEEECSQSIVDKYWVCMDGCYNMQKVIYDNFSISNQTLKGCHRECSNICADQLNFNKYLEEEFER